MNRAHVYLVNILLYVLGIIIFLEFTTILGALVVVIGFLYSLSLYGNTKPKTKPKTKRKATKRKSGSSKNVKMSYVTYFDGVVTRYESRPKRKIKKHYTFFTHSKKHQTRKYQQIKKYSNFRK